jgi:hypothetical protein
MVTLSLFSSFTYTPSVLAMLEQEIFRAGSAPENAPRAPVSRRQRCCAPDLNYGFSS